MYRHLASCNYLIINMWQIFIDFDITMCRFIKIYITLILYESNSQDKIQSIHNDYSHC
jgi:hypothetical protein